MPKKAFLPVLLGLLIGSSVASAHEPASRPVQPLPPDPRWVAQEGGPVQPLPPDPRWIPNEDAPVQALPPDPRRLSRERREGIRWGAYGTLLGPNSLIGAGLLMQPIPLFEASLWFGGNSASATEQTVDRTASSSAKIKLNTFMLRGRFWLQERHSLVVEVGAGFTSYSISATGSDNLGNSLAYARSGSPPIGTLGLAYGFRTNGGFRLTVGGGAMFHGSTLGASTISSTGSFSQSDRDTLRTSIDSTVDNLTKTRAYLDLSIGFLFW